MPASTRTRRWLILFIWAVAVVIAFWAYGHFRPFNYSRGARMTGGDPELGRKKLAAYSCVSCHIIPGIPDATGTFAPSLASWSRRSRILDISENTPANLEAWLEHPSRLKAETSMPDMNVRPEDSRDMAAYLYSLN